MFRFTGDSWDPDWTENIGSTAAPAAVASGGDNWTPEWAEVAPAQPQQVGCPPHVSHRLRLLASTATPGCLSGRGTRLPGSSRWASCCYGTIVVSLRVTCLSLHTSRSAMCRCVLFSGHCNREIPPGNASWQHIWNARPARVNAPPTLSSPLSTSQTLQDYM